MADSHLGDAISLVLQLVGHPGQVEAKVLVLFFELSYISSGSVSFFSGNSGNLLDLNDFRGIVGDLVGHVSLDPGHGGVVVHELLPDLIELAVQQIDEFLISHGAAGSTLRMIQ